MSASVDHPATDFAAAIEALRARELLRVRRVVDSACGPEVVVDGRKLLAFCSNDYLGLANAPQLLEAAQAGLARYGLGAGASHLISGHYAAHHALEDRLASFVGLPRALYFSTGYMANIGAITALCQDVGQITGQGAGHGVAVFSDALNHASLIDAIRLSGAHKHVYPHLDLAALEAQLRSSTAARKLVVSDAVFSMDGDVAPLPELLNVCVRHDAWLLIDDAHGFGVLGERGQGSLAHFAIDPMAHPRLIYMGTLGKAAGVAGAFVAAQGEVVEWLLQRARSYVYTTGAPPMLAQALLTSVDLIEQGAARRGHLQALIVQLRAGLEALCAAPGAATSWQLLPSITPIQPLILGTNAEALRIGQALLNEGLWVPAIRPPTVPAGSARLRITLSAAHTSEQVARLLVALAGLQH